MAPRSSPLSLYRSLPWLASALLMWAASAQAEPLEGRVWDTRSKSFLSPDAALALIVRQPAVLLGEKHDSQIHHALQLQVLQALQKKGRRPVLAMEQLDRENQDAIATALADPALRELSPQDAAERVADLGKLNKKGWRWPMYRDVLAFALQQRWSVAGANLSRKQGRDIAMGATQVTLPRLPAAAIAALEDDLTQGHCGQKLEPTHMQAMVTAQRARDLMMAQTLEPWGSEGVVLIAGAGHVRRDRAAPAYFRNPASAAQSISVAFTEVDAGKTNPQDYDAQGFDLLWFTPKTEREDPCAKPLGGSLAPKQ